MDQLKHWAPLLTCCHHPSCFRNKGLALCMRSLISHLYQLLCPPDNSEHISHVLRTVWPSDCLLWKSATVLRSFSFINQEFLCLIQQRASVNVWFPFSCLVLSTTLRLMNLSISLMVWYGSIKQPVSLVIVISSAYLWSNLLAWRVTLHALII